MKNVTRFLAMAGMGVVAAVTMAGPAQAAASHDTSAAKRPAAVKHWDNDRNNDWDRGRGRDHVVRYYSPRQAWKCHVDGRRGERFGIYRDYDCERVRRGPHRGWVALEVEYNRRGGGWGR